MEAPPPLLGQPFGYQTLVTCNGGPNFVCPPEVQNNLATASMDFVICFSVAFAASFAILLGLRSRLASRSSLGRNALPATLLLITIVAVSLTGFGSVASGSSLVQPHWPTPSGVEVFPSDITIYSGSASTPYTQGTARMTLILENYYWTSLNASVLLTLTGPNLESQTNVTIYQCPSPSSCLVVSGITIPRYYALSLNATTTALYLGIQIEKGQTYQYELTMVGDGLTAGGSVVAV